MICDDRQCNPQVRLQCLQIGASSQVVSAKKDSHRTLSRNACGVPKPCIYSASSDRSSRFVNSSAAF
jgi:hypothetical protein